MDFDDVAARCAPLVAVSTLRALASVESSFNPHAVGVVNGRLVRQPKNLLEAVATVESLQAQKLRFSAGLIQIYVGNWSAYNLNSETVFEPCANLRAAQGILGDCYRRALPVSLNEQEALRKSFSCYYSNNFATGFSAGYVQKVVAYAVKGEGKTSKNVGMP